VVMRWWVQWFLMLSQVYQGSLVGSPAHKSCLAYGEVLHAACFRYGTQVAQSAGGWLIRM
jgi:hypothetical protein